MVELAITSSTIRPRGRDRVCCVPIKIGEEAALAGRRIGPEDVAFLKSGITTRDEVVSKLGASTFDLSDLGILSYVWIELKEEWAIIWALPPRM